MMKIDKNGFYIGFKGITIISSLFERHHEFCTTLYQKLSTNPMICQYFSPLPQESYHMTAINLFTEEDVTDWNQFISINKRFFMNIRQLLTTAPADIDASIKKIHTQGVIQLLIELSPEQQRYIYNLGEKLKLKEKIPSVFHITLAYQYKTLPTEQKQRIEHEICRVITEAIGINQRLKLSSPILSSFEDMTAFAEWNGISNPFEMPSSQEKKAPQSKTRQLFEFFLSSLKQKSLDNKVSSHVP